jgi:hypothetical protein
MNLDKVSIGSSKKDNRKTDIESNYKKKIINEVVLEIPRGYKISYLPGNTEYNDELFGFKILYKASENEVRLTREIYINYLLLKPSKTREWNSMLNALNGAYKSSIVLTRK